MLFASRTRRMRQTGIYGANQTDLINKANRDHTIIK